MRFIFVRHAHYEKDCLTANQRDAAKLSPLGVVQAKLVGEFLRGNQVWPDSVLINRKTRSRQTAEIILQTLHCPISPVVPKHTGFRTATVQERICEWFEETGLTRDQSLMLVASRTQMHSLIRNFGCSPPDGEGHGFTLVCEVDVDGHWQVRNTFQPPPKQQTTNNKETPNE